jgi:hypothetical protein
MIKTFFDLDGVIRDLEKSVFGYRVPTWDTPVEGMEFFEYIEYKGLQLVDRAIPTKFYKTIHSFYKKNPQHTLTILTHQPAPWKKYTERWILAHFHDTKYQIQYTEKMMGKLHLLDGAVLIDDYPGFAGNPNVIMVNKTYNQYDSAPHLRISKAFQMAHVLEYLYSEKSCIENLYKDLAEYGEGAYSCPRL